MNTRLSMHEHVKLNPCHAKISVREVTDEEKQATLRCSRCATYYKYEENHRQACLHHHGSTSFSLPAWTCCRDIRLDYPGCCTSFHQEDEQTSTILDAIGERKQMIEEWRGKLDTKDIPIVLPGQKEGYLEKLEDESSNKWKKYYFVLNKNRLHFYAAPKAKRLGEIKLQNAMYRTDKQYSWLEIIDTMTKSTCRLRTAPVELQGWKEALLYTTEKLKQQSSLHDEWVYISFPEALPTTPRNNNNNNDNSETENSNETETPKKDELKENDDDKFIIHHVTGLDTMQGLCIRYNSTIDAIMKSNNMITKNEFHGFKTIRIPRDPFKPLPDARPPPQESEFQKKKNATNRMMAKFNLKDREEAIYYLEECEWDYEKAVAMYKEDAMWQTAHEKKKK